MRSEDAERDGGHGWSKHVARDAHKGLRRQHDREARRESHGHGADAQHGRAPDDDRAFPMAFVDESADRRLKREADDARDGRDNADLGLVPVLFGEQENAHIRPKSASHIRQEKVEPIERRPE